MSPASHRCVLVQQTGGCGDYSVTLHLVGVGRYVTAMASPVGVDVMSRVAKQLVRVGTKVVSLGLKDKSESLS